MATSSQQPVTESVTGPASRPEEQPSAIVGGGVGQLFVLLLAWAAAGSPLAWGVLETLRPGLALFQ